MANKESQKKIINDFIPTSYVESPLGTIRLFSETDILKMMDEYENRLKIKVLEDNNHHPSHVLQYPEATC